MDISAIICFILILFIWEITNFNDLRIWTSLGAEWSKSEWTGTFIIDWSLRVSSSEFHGVIRNLGLRNFEKFGEGVLLWGGLEGEHNLLITWWDKRENEQRAQKNFHYSWARAFTSLHTIRDSIDNQSPWTLNYSL